jgi:uncharacterized membrane protein
MISANGTKFRGRVMAAIVATVIFTTLALASAVPAWAASEARAASKDADSAPDQSVASRKNKNDVVIRGHGFVASNGVFTTIDAPGAGLYTVVFGIDDDGRAVGGYVDDRGRLHGFLKDKEAFTQVDFPGAAATFVSRINAQGQIVGAYSDDPNVPALELPHGFLLDNGVFTRIDVPGAVRTQPYSINARGQLVGEYQDAAGTFHGFLRDSSGTFTTIDLPGATATSVTGINDRGQMVGQYIDAGRQPHGFLLAQGVITTIDVPGAAGGTAPFAINTHGQIVGISSDGVRARGFLLSNGTFTRITPQGAFIPFVIGTFATDIDDRGRIAGASL